MDCDARPAHVADGPARGWDDVRVGAPRPRPSGHRSDGELMQACRDGDQAAWDELVGRYERLVFSVALRNGVSREDASDITQMTFIALMEALDGVRNEDRLAYWLMTVARRLTWRVNRRGDRERHALDRLPEVWREDAIAEWERASQLYDGVLRLEPPCRDLLLALYFRVDEPSYADIARELDRPIGAIGPMRARCLQRLRAILGEDLAP